MSTDLFLASLTPQSTMAELPAWNVRLPATSRGSDLDEILRRDPELPGVVIVDPAGICGAISRAQYQNVVSRPFGGEIVRPRAIGTLLGELAPGAVMLLDASLPVQEALRRSLTRDRALIYEPVLVTRNGGGDVRLVAFNDLLRADSRISALRNQQMKEILATVQEGFLLVDRDHRIASEFSKSVEAIFGRTDIAGRELPSLLREMLSAEQADLARQYLETLFNPNVIERLVADINPLQSVEVPERPGRPRQHLGFAFRRSMEGREIRRLLVRVEDRTREVELAAELEEQQRQAGQRVDLAMEMMQADPAALTDYLTRFLAEISQIIRLRTQENGRPPRAKIDAIFRILHGLKGEAGIIGLRSFAEQLHRTEDVAALLRDGDASGPREIERLDPWLDSLRGLGDEAKDLIARLSALGSKPRQNLTSAIEALIGDLSTRLGKRARFVVHGNPDDLPPAYRSAVREALIQLTRNAMVHGIETEAERRQFGKAVPALLQFAVRRHETEGQWELLFQDDGRGLDFRGIRQRALERFGSSEMEAGEAAQLIFEPGFSTASTTTSDAGRGVGLDLVRETIEKLGGSILVHSEPGVFCAFQIVLPLEPEVAS